MLFKPNNLSALGAVTGNALSAKAPEVKIPEVGDTMLMSVMPWGAFSVINEHDNIQNGSQVLEVEVKAIKKAKLIVE